MKNLRKILAIFGVLILYAYFVNIVNLASKVILLQGEKYSFNTCPFIEVTETASVSNNEESNYNIELNLFGKYNLKTISVTEIKNLEVIPCGDVIGLKLYTNGVLVVGMSEVEDIDKNKVKPYENSHIQEGDTIIQINNDEIDSVNTLKEIVNKSKGEALDLIFVRDGTVLTSSIIPAKVSNSEYKLGLWVRDAATGVGTLTYYNPESDEFGALGHGISDSDTGKMIDIESGELVTSKIISITKGISGNAGELRGTILNQPTIGKVNKNTNFGIFGILDKKENLNINYNKKMKVALRNELELGDATILCNIDGDGVKEYKIKIEKIYLDNNEDNKSFMIRVCDEKLIEKTGGIIRGLSGAPIIQNEKFVGAVTNVLVANPEVGYGIFADLMIKNGK